MTTNNIPALFIISLALVCGIGILSITVCSIVENKAKTLQPISERGAVASYVEIVKERDVQFAEMWADARSPATREVLRDIRKTYLTDTIELGEIMLKAHELEMAQEQPINVAVTPNEIKLNIERLKRRLSKSH